jgi:hypothetical protein
MAAEDLTRKDYVDAVTLDISSTAEAQAGTDDTTAISPLKLRQGLNASGTAPIYAPRAWVNFNGTGVVAIRQSGNISSVTDLGVGSYQPNTITTLPDADYAIAGMGNINGTNANTNEGIEFNTLTATSFRIRSTSSRAGNTAADFTHITAIVAR